MIAMTDQKFYKSWNTYTVAAFKHKFVLSIIKVDISARFDC